MDLYEALARLQIEYNAQFWSAEIRKDVKTLEKGKGDAQNITGDEGF